MLQRSVLTAFSALAGDDRSMIQMAEGVGISRGLLSEEQAALLEEMISEKLSTISNRYICTNHW